jgi:hypothetical protein
MFWGITYNFPFLIYWGRCNMESLNTYEYIKPLETKRRLLYLKTQSVPRRKNFISIIKTKSLFLLR